MENLKAAHYKTMAPAKYHEQAAIYGRNLLIQWGFEFNDLKKDGRFNKRGLTSVSLCDIIFYKEKEAILLWCGVNSLEWTINKKIVDSIISINENTKLKVFVCYIIFNGYDSLDQVRFVSLDMHKYNITERGGGGGMYEFEDLPPHFTKSNFLKLLNNEPVY